MLAGCLDFRVFSILPGLRPSFLIWIITGGKYRKTLNESNLNGSLAKIVTELVIPDMKLHFCYFQVQERRSPTNETLSKRLRTLRRCSMTSLRFMWEILQVVWNKRWPTRIGYTNRWSLVEKKSADFQGLHDIASAVV